MMLTKSKYLIGLQCPKYLWTVFNEKDSIPEPDKQQEHIFQQGTLIGEYAKKLFPKGINIEQENFNDNLIKTKELIEKKKTLFEAGFLTENIYSRADILIPVKDEWDIIEVKSGTQVKDINIHDVSFQKFVYEKCGLKIRKCFLLHINNKFVKKGKINPKDLFIKEDITSKVNEFIIDIEDRISEMFDIINHKKKPENGISKDCLEPYACPLKDECWSFVPENSVFDFYRMGKKAFEIVESGVLSIEDLPDEYKLNDKQEIQKKCVKNGKPFIHKESLKHFLRTLHYPLYFMDFETYGTAIPLFDGVKPYQQIPFQFSLHVKHEDGKMEHYEFLAEGTGDPRKKFMNELKKVIGEKGSIVVYNQSFEKNRIKECAEVYPEFKKVYNNIDGRIVDLIIPFRNFSYYHPKQCGSCSIKKVLPALTGKSYSELDIADGGTASLDYLYITFGSSDGSKASEKEIKKVRSDLLKYCGLDTEGMVLILDKLYKLVK